MNKKQNKLACTVRKNVHFSRFAKISGIALFVVAAFCLLPPAPTVDNEATAATTYLFSSAQTAPTLSLTTDKSAISITANPTSTLATGKVTNTVSTTNYAGYKLTANLSGTSTNLTHSTISSKNIPSITSSYTSSNFPTGYWGVSLDDTNYQSLPASNATALQLKNQTTAATNQTVALTVGAKVNQNQANGNYTNTINLTATANAANYTITYDKNTTDTVSNLPSAQTGTVSANAVTLSSNTPTRTGYTFLGWSENSAATSATFASGASVYMNQTQSNASITLYAVWKINTYTVTFSVPSTMSDFGTVNRSSITVNYGSSVVINGATATVAGTATTATATTATAQYSYAFKDWTNGCGATVTGNCTISANFTRNTNRYYIDYKTGTFDYGVVHLGSNATTDDFNSSSGSFPVEYGTAVLINGATITAGNYTFTAYQRPTTAQYSYAFTGWTNDCGATVTGACTITANFTRTTRSYTVTFAATPAGYGSLTRTSQASIPYGTAVSISGATTTINSVATTATATTATAQYSYAFKDWTNGCGATVTGNCTISANFTRTTRSYTVTFAVNTSGYGTTSRSTQTVTYGGAVSISGATATVAGTNTTATATTATAQYSYAFSNWTNNCGTTVTANCTITANFTRTTRSYTVTFAVSPSGYGTTSRSTQTVTYGGAVSTSGATATVAGTATTASAAAQTAQYTYAFSSWTNGCGATVTGNCTITANFTRSTRSYTVTFAVNTSGYGSLTRTSQASIPYGTAVSISGATTTINSVATTATATTATAQYSYAFSNWTNGCGSTVTGNCTITANFTRSTRSYTVTFAVSPSGYGTTSRATQTVTYGGAVSTSGATATVAGTATTATAATTTAQYSYAFSSWTNGCGATVTGNCTITANFTRTTRSYTVTFAMNPTSGYGSLTRTSQSVAYGSAVSISGASVTIASTTTTATPTQATGYSTVFSSWTNNCGSTVTAACTITAKFTRTELPTFNSISNMQDMTSTLCANTAEGFSKQLKDTRDNKYYWVTKMKDGNCWMTQNLDYDIVATNIISNNDGTTSTWTVSEEINRTNSYQFGQWYNSDDSFSVHSYDPGNVKLSGSSTVSATDLTSSTAVGDTSLHSHLGNYYKYRAATANGRENSSICPAGWRLPNGNDATNKYYFKKLVDAYSITTGGSAIESSPLYLVPVGYISSSAGGSFFVAYRGILSYYWTATPGSNSQNAYAFYTANGTGAFPYDSSWATISEAGIWIGASVRCVAI